MRELVAENKPADVTLVYGKLRKKDNLKVGDLEGVRRLLEFNARPDLLGYWLDEVKNIGNSVSSLKHAPKLS